MTTPRTRSLSRLALPAALGTALTTALTSVVLAAPPAEAAWQGFGSIHGGVVQACTRPVDSSKLLVRVRLDNRRAAHTHVAAASAPDGRSRRFRMAAGRVSTVKSLVVRRSGLVQMGIGEVTGEGLGDSYPARSIARC